MINPRQHLLNLAPYVLPDTTAPQSGRNFQLAQNESAFGASSRVAEALAKISTQTQLYPDADFTGLRKAIGTVHGLPAEQILCGGGSLSLINLLTQVFLEPNDEVVTSEFSYLYFRTASKLAQATIVLADEPNYTVDVDLLLAKVTDKTKIVFVANPGNPTGSMIAYSEIEKLRDRLPNDVLLIVDEAYAEYVSDFEPTFDLVGRGNTVVLRTFSKIYGLAGLRVGWAFMPPAIVDFCRRVQMPNSVSVSAQVAAAAAMGDQDFVRKVREESADILTSFTQALKTLNLNPLPSHTNFVLCELDSPETATALETHLRNEGIIVRVMRGYGMPNCVRFTLGTREQMAEVVEVLRGWETKNS